MKILVTGAAGFLGTRLIKTLLSAESQIAGATIVAADIAPCRVEDARVDVRTGSIAETQPRRSLRVSSADPLG